MLLAASFIAGLLCIFISVEKGVVTWLLIVGIVLALPGFPIVVAICYLPCAAAYRIACGCRDVFRSFVDSWEEQGRISPRQFRTGEIDEERL